MLNPDRPLYYRLGGYDAVAAFTDELMVRLHADPQIGVFWKGKCEDSRKRDRQLLVDFLCDVTGGPVLYGGRDMRTSHKGLTISESDWNVFAGHAAAVLDDLGVRDPERTEVMALAAGFHDEIVEEGGPVRSAVR
jgi:hemoglobin